MIEVPSAQDIADENDPVRRAILEAMSRLLDGRPVRAAPGNATVSALALEAGIKRHWLNGTHMDLRDRFVFLRDRTDDPTHRETDSLVQLALARDEVSRLTERLKLLSVDRDNWKAAAEVFLRAMNVQEREIEKRDVEKARAVAELERMRAVSPSDDLAARRHRRP